MARQLRIQYAGACYHVMARGDRREPIVEDEVDREEFVATLGRACAKTGWRVHAWVLMSNHYHCLIQTPEPNLVDGMKWLQNTFTRRFNIRKQRWGHVFGGRYKAVVVDPEDSGGYYFERLIDYIHLNPVRAGIDDPARRLGLLEHRWSSLHAAYAVTPSKRPPWAETAPGFAVSGCKDTAAGRKRYVEQLEARWKLSQSEGDGAGREPQTLQSTLRRGWYWGSETLKEKLLSRRDGKTKPVKSRDYRLSRQERDHAQARAERIVAGRLREAGVSKGALEKRAGNDALKVEIAAEVWKTTCVSQAWIAARLAMGSTGNVSLQLHRRNKKSTQPR